MDPERRILVGLRLHRAQSTQNPQDLINALEACLQSLWENILNIQNELELIIAIAFDGADSALSEALCISAEKFNLEKSLREKKITVNLVPVPVWLGFTPALNSLISFAHKQQCRFIMFLSIEVRLGWQHVEAMHRLLTDNTDLLCVGMRLQGHDFYGSSSESKEKTAETTHEIRHVPLSGTTTPWNTLCMWRLSLLARTGFLMISDGIVEGVGPAIEEATVIGLQQHLFSGPEGPITPRAVLLDMPQDEPVQWLCNFENEARRQWHEQKMRSKNERFLQQLTGLNLLKANEQQVRFQVEHHMLNK